jgi:hypothetical protein
MQWLKHSFVFLCILSEFLSAATFVLPQALLSLSNCLLFPYHAAVISGGGGVVQAGRQILASGSLSRSGQTLIGEPKIGEHAQ